MGRKKKERQVSSSEEDEASNSQDESSSSSSDTKEHASPKPRKKQSDREDHVKPKESRQDQNLERSRWESPDGRKRKHSPDQNQHKHSLTREEKRRGPRMRQDGSETKTKWDKNERDRDAERDSDKRRKEDNRGKNFHDNQRRRDRDAPEKSSRNDNRENRPDDRFDSRRQSERKSPRRDDRSRTFDERERRNRTNGERGSRQRGRNRKFMSNDRSWNSFDASKVKNEPSPEWGKPKVKIEKDGNPVEKEKPNFEPSGKLTEDANTVNGVVIKYTEPLEARKPKRRWRLYPFKGEKALPTLYVHRQSAYLMGRDRKVADIPLDHPSCSKQHAALQFRLVPFKREDGGEGKRVRPYLIDLESANGTFVNDIKLEPRRYHELMERDVLRFGFSSREYVLLHEQSKDDALDDDVPLPVVAPK